MGEKGWLEKDGGWMVDFGEREGRGIAYEGHMIIIHEILHIVIKGEGFLGLERYP